MLLLHFYDLVTINYSGAAVKEKKPHSPVWLLSCREFAFPSRGIPRGAFPFWAAWTRHHGPTSIQTLLVRLLRSRSGCIAQCPCAEFSTWSWPPFLKCHWTNQRTTNFSLLRNVIVLLHLTRQEENYDQGIEDWKPLNVGVRHAFEDVIPPWAPFH